MKQDRIEKAFAELNRVGRINATIAERLGPDFDRLASLHRQVGPLADRINQIAHSSSAVRDALAAMVEG
jgi:hypothetical protein